MPADDKLLRLALSQQVARNINENLSASLIGFALAERSNRQSERQSEILQWWETLLKWWNNFVQSAEGYFYNTSPIYEKWKSSFPLDAEIESYYVFAQEFLERAQPLESLITNNKLKQAFDYHNKVSFSSVVDKIVNFEQNFLMLKSFIEKVELDMGEIANTLNGTKDFVDQTTKEITDLFNFFDAQKLIKDIQIEYLHKIENELKIAYSRSLSDRENNFAFLKKNFPIGEGIELQIQGSQAEDLVSLQGIHIGIVNYREDLLRHISEERLIQRKKKFESAANLEKSPKSYVDDLVELSNLYDGGFLTQEEFETAKRQILNNLS